jgi:hypothetical protein
MKLSLTFVGRLVWPLLIGSPLLAQAPNGAAVTLPDIPTVSTRSFTGGSARVTVSGAITIDTELPLNARASYGDGEMTWIQFGTAEAGAPNVLITYGGGDLGVIVGMGSKTATAEGAHCTGSVQATATTVAGEYRCKDVDSWDPKTSRMGKIEISIRFTAKS